MAEKPIIFGADVMPEGIVFGAEVEPVPDGTIIYGVNDHLYGQWKPGNGGFASELLRKWLP